MNIAEVLNKNVLDNKHNSINGFKVVDSFVFKEQSQSYFKKDNIIVGIIVHDYSIRIKARSNENSKNFVFIDETFEYDNYAQLGKIINNILNYDNLKDELSISLDMKWDNTDNTGVIGFVNSRS